MTESNTTHDKYLAIDTAQADEKFGGAVRPLPERQIRRSADREVMQGRARMRKFAAGLAVGALLTTGAAVGLKREVSHDNQQARADHAALEANAVKPTEAELKAEGIVLPPNGNENQN